MMMKNKVLFFILNLSLLFFVICCATPGISKADQQYLSDNAVSRNETTDIDKKNHSNSIKIWGGTESKIGDWPWMTALLLSDQPNNYQAQFCSGVLIGRSWILTAAHCAYGKFPSDIEVAVGAYDLRSSLVNRTQVKSIHIHPQYNATHLQNDIALLEINQPSFQHILPLFAGESRENVPVSMLGEMTTAIGWGMADGSSYAYYPEKLRQVDLPIVSSSYCNNIYSSPHLLSSQICAGYYEGKDACNGDSGGPIVSKIDGTWIHVGLVSYGTPCDMYNGWYGVYTRTLNYIDFIKQYVPDVSIHPNKSKENNLQWILLLLSDMNELIIQKSGTGSGSVTSTPTGINCGSDCSESYETSDQSITLIALANIGSTFTGWSDQGCPGTGACHVLVDSVKTVTANFSLNSPSISQ